MSVLFVRMNYFRNNDDAIMFDMLLTQVIMPSGALKEPLKEIVYESTEAAHGYCNYMGYLVVYELEADELVLEVHSQVEEDLEEDFEIIHRPLIMTEQIMGEVAFIMEQMGIDYAHFVELLSYGRYASDN